MTELFDESVSRITEALDALKEYQEQHDSPNLSVRSIRFYSRGSLIECYDHTRALRENDCVRGMDEVTYRYEDGRIYSEEEWEKLMEEEQENG